MRTITRKTTDNISISLPKDLRKELFSYAKKQETTVSSLIKEAVKSYLLINEWKEIQKVFEPAMRRAGIFTDEDVENYFK